jgi:GT2 family glycosyltransferase
VTLSIIIVNYNAKFLLEQCLQSLQAAASGISHEIIVLDNHSTDGSREYLQSGLSDVKYVFNDENTGFTKACNQGAKLSTGKYLLFLNPDTLLQADSLARCISFFEKTADAGAVGVRMTNGDGKFLKESKRAFPSPATSFFKLFGLAFIFPKSGILAGYYMPHLPEKEIHPVDVLSGAFMMVNREVFEKTGGFDETFFMYGEDIDLCRRIQQSGYKNYYLGTVTISHLKGGSTVFNYQYIQNFYGAMRLFVKKYYAGKRKPFFTGFLYAGILIRKGLAILSLPFR